MCIKLLPGACALCGGHFISCQFHGAEKGACCLFILPLTHMLVQLEPARLSCVEADAVCVLRHAVYILYSVSREISLKFNLQV